MLVVRYLHYTGVKAYKTPTIYQLGLSKTNVWLAICKYAI